MVEDSLQIVLLLFLSVAVVICLTYQSLAISHRYPLDYGEAPLVDQAMRLAAGQNIYRTDLSTPPYSISNYPPLYVVALIPWLQWFGPSFAAGRVISVLCAWASGVFLSLIIYTQTRDRLAAVIAGSILLAFPYVVSWSSLLRIDLLALASSLAGLYLLAAWPLPRWQLLAGAILLVAAIYTRQSYALAAPLAALAWLWANDRRWAIGLAGLVGGLTLALFLLLNTVTRGGFYFNIVAANIHEFGIERLQWNLDRLWKTAAILLCLGGASLALLRRWNPLWPLGAPYLIGAALSALTIGKIGSNVNYLLELCAALSLVAGSMIAWSRKQTSLQIARVALLALLTYQTGLLIQTTLRETTWDLYERRAACHELQRLEKIVADTPDPVLADEYMGMLTLQGRWLTIEPFIVTQMSRTGMWDQTPVVQGIQDKQYPLILIHYFRDYPVYRERWTPEMLSAIERAYAPEVMLANTRVYRPIADRVTVDRCPGAPWRLPSSGALGLKWEAGGLNFYGQGREGTVPVYAIADGLLTRSPDWVDAVAIQHDDPLQPGQKVWSYYANMRSGSGLDSYVTSDLPPGSTSIPVKAGQLLGYQGAWSGQANWSGWVHMHFAVIQATDQGTFPSHPQPENMLDPSPYLRLGPGASNITCRP